MKTAIKVFSIISIILRVIAIIIFASASKMAVEMVQNEYDAGMLIVDGAVPTQEEFEAILEIIPIIFDVIIFFIVISIILPVLNLVFVYKEMKTATLIIGIVNIIFGASIILGVIDIIYYLTNDKNQKPKLDNLDDTITFE